MASKQISQNEFITQSVVKAARVAIQMMATAGISRQGIVEPNMSGPIMKLSYFQLEHIKAYMKNVEISS